MMPLIASLIFVLISVVVSIFRHLFLSTSHGHNDDSNISLTKIHTLTVPHRNTESFVYNSLYELYYKPQQHLEPPPSLPYNSYTLKKAILNNEGVYICEQRFAAIFQQRIFCDEAKIECKWKTFITVYRLPFLKKEQSQQLQVDGRVMDHDGFNNKLYCFSKKINYETFYQINFALIPNWKESKEGPSWSMNSLIIEEQHADWRRGFFIGPFKIKLAKWNLKNTHHNPNLYSFEDKCLSYVTKEEPWLIHYNCGTWNSFNILNPEIQKTIFNSKNSGIFIPPFSSTHHVTPLYLKLFKSTQKIYPPVQNCLYNCERQELIIQQNYLTLVFEIINSPKRFGKLIIQITLSLEDQIQKTHLTSFSLITSENNLQKATFIDCNIHTKEYQILKGSYTYQLNLRDQNMAAILQKHSLMCGFTYQHADQLNIIQISDVIGNFKIHELPHELILCSQEVINQKRLENLLQKKIGMKPKQDEAEEDGWFDFDLFSFQYNLDQNTEKNNLAEGNQGIQNDNDKRLKVKKLQKKKKKKGKKERKSDKKIIKFGDNAIGEKLQQIADTFDQEYSGTAIELTVNKVIAPLPLLLNAENEFKIISGDLQFPIIYIQGQKKFLLTYQPKEEQDSKQNKNKTVKTMNQAYSFKYSQINAEMKHPSNYIAHFDNQTIKTKKREDLQILDRFIIELTQHNGDILNQIKSISVVDAKYDDGFYHLRLSGMNKPFKKHVVVAWGWGIEVYEINWDRKGMKTQIVEIEQQFMHKKVDGIEMMVLIPFIELFATVYCLFQALINSR